MKRNTNKRANGWNFYKNGIFQFTLKEQSEDKTRIDIALYLKVNNLNPTDEKYTIQRFENYDNNNFKLLTI